MYVLSQQYLKKKIGGRGENSLEKKIHEKLKLLWL